MDALTDYKKLQQERNRAQSEPVASRVQRYADAAKILRTGFKDIGLEFLIPEDWRSNCLTGLRLPKGVGYEKLHAELKANGFIIYAGQGNLSDTIFRIANMGDITNEEFERFLQILKTTCSNIIRHFPFALNLKRIQACSGRHFNIRAPLGG